MYKLAEYPFAYSKKESDCVQGIISAHSKSFQHTPKAGWPHCGNRAGASCNSLLQLIKPRTSKHHLS